VTTAGSPGGAQPGNIYKILSAAAWAAALATGVYAGSDDDARDGFIHFSRAHQVAATARKHFAGKTDLLLLEVRAETLGAALGDETSRGGELFPHLYGPLPVALVRRVLPLPWNGQAHDVPPLGEDASGPASPLQN